LCQDLMGKDQDDPDGDERTKRGSALCHDARGIAYSMPEWSD